MLRSVEVEAMRVRKEDGAHSLPILAGSLELYADLSRPSQLWSGPELRRLSPLFPCLLPGLLAVNWPHLLGTLAHARDPGA